MRKCCLIFILLLIIFHYEGYAQSLINNKDYNNLNNWEFFSEPFGIQKSDIIKNKNTY